MKAPFNQAALVRSSIAREPFLFGKAVSSLEPPDYRGVFTRGPLRGTLKQKTAPFFKMPPVVFFCWEFINRKESFAPAWRQLTI